MFWSIVRCLLQLENARVKQKMKRMQETINRLSGVSAETDNLKVGATEADLDYDDIGRDFILVGGLCFSSKFVSNIIIPYKFEGHFKSFFQVYNSCIRTYLQVLRILLVWDSKFPSEMKEASSINQLNAITGKIYWFYVGVP